MKETLRNTIGRPALPTCGKCGTAIERLVEEVDSFGRLVFTAQCHGEIERTVIDPGEGTPQKFTVAFRQPKALTP